MRFGSLFTGIGGFDLGFERAGMECAWQVEIDDYCNKVLAKHWPDVKRYGDVRELHGVFSHSSRAGQLRKEQLENDSESKRNWRSTDDVDSQGEVRGEVWKETICPSCLEPVDLICGGFPCQPYSVAGKRRGEKDDRNLWPDFLRIVREVRPAWVVGENVPGIVPLYLDTVLSDLEGEAYTCWTINIPACAFDAPHRRERIFVIAHRECLGREARAVSSALQSEIEIAEGQDAEQLREVVAHALGTDGRGGKAIGESNRQERESTQAERESLQSGYRETYSGELEQSGKDVAYATSERFERHEHQKRISAWSVEPNVGRVAHGVPNRVDRLRALGNAVVPQVAEWIGRRIHEVQVHRGKMRISK
jgi:DNA (cytosine-5)-methyltransferase 1